MSGPKKLGGLLIEQSARDTLVVGFGLNVRNAPWEHDPALKSISTSLAAEAGSVPSLEEISVRVLNALADAHSEMQKGGMAAAIDELNNRWAEPVDVDILLSGGEHVFGRFSGLDASGNLKLLDKSNLVFLVEHQRIEKLLEIS
jgi:biotin-(acetyl-CoA carboxylase) ligase